MTAPPTVGEFIAITATEVSVVAGRATDEHVTDVLLPRRKEALQRLLSVQAQHTHTPGSRRLPVGMSSSSRVTVPTTSAHRRNARTVRTSLRERTGPALIHHRNLPPRQRHQRQPSGDSTTTSAISNTTPSGRPSSPPSRTTTTSTITGTTPTVSPSSAEQWSKRDPP